MLGTNNGVTARRQREQWPVSAELVDDFYQALAFHDSFDWNEMPPAWQRAQRLLAVEYYRLQMQLQVKILHKKLL